MINSDNSIQINIKFTFAVHEYMIVYEYIWIYFIIQFDIYIYTICIYYIHYTYIYTIYIYVYIYIYIYMNFAFLFIATLSQLIHTMVTLISHSYDLFQLVLLVETAYTIVQNYEWSKLLLNKPEQLSQSLFCSSWWSFDRFQT